MLTLGDSGLSPEHSAPPPGFCRHGPGRPGGLGLRLPGGSAPRPLQPVSAWPLGGTQLVYFPLRKSWCPAVLERHRCEPGNPPGQAGCFPRDLGAWPRLQAKHSLCSSPGGSPSPVYGVTYLVGSYVLALLGTGNLGRVHKAVFPWRHRVGALPALSSSQHGFGVPHSFSQSCSPCPGGRVAISALCVVPSCSDTSHGGMRAATPAGGSTHNLISSAAHPVSK